MSPSEAAQSSIYIPFILPPGAEFAGCVEPELPESDTEDEIIEFTPQEIEEHPEYEFHALRYRDIRHQAAELDIELADFRFHIRDTTRLELSEVDISGRCYFTLATVGTT